MQTYHQQYQQTQQNYPQHQPQRAYRQQTSQQELSHNQGQQTYNSEQATSHHHQPEANITGVAPTSHTATSSTYSGSSDWNNFNNVKTSQNFALIPAGTILKVRMSIKPGGYNDPARGWTENYASHNAEKKSVYLNVEFTVLAGKYTKRKMWGLIGLYSSTTNWADAGRRFIRSILNSAYGIKDSDDSPEAQKIRCIKGLGALDGLEFVAQVGITKDNKDRDKNIIKQPVAVDHDDYTSVMRG